MAVVLVEVEVQGIMMEEMVVFQAVAVEQQEKEIIILVLVERVVEVK